MDKSWLPKIIQTGLSHLNEQLLSQLRLREGKPVVVNYNGEQCYLSEYGVTSDRQNAIRFFGCNDLFLSLCATRLNDFQEQIKKSFITLPYGVRVGIAGEYVYEDNKLLSIRNVTSLCIRIPHELSSFVPVIQRLWKENGFGNTILYGKPSCGKTTLLRAIAKALGSDVHQSVLLLDERNEICAQYQEDGFDVGEYTDVMLGVVKRQAVEDAIRSLSPTVILMDELDNVEDEQALRFVLRCGIPLIVTTHFTEREVLLKWKFDYYAFLHSRESMVVYDKDFNTIGNYSIVDVGRVDYQTGT